MRAVKGNKVYTIDEAMQKRYQDEGFDIQDESGYVIAYGKGKTVTMNEHMAAVAEIERLQKMVTELQEDGSKEDSPENEKATQVEDKKTTKKPANGKEQ